MQGGGGCQPPLRSPGCTAKSWHSLAVGVGHKGAGHHPAEEGAGQGHGDHHRLLGGARGARRVSRVPARRSAAAAAQRAPLARATGAQTPRPLLHSTDRYRPPGRASCLRMRSRTRTRPPQVRGRLGARLGLCSSRPPTGPHWAPGWPRGGPQWAINHSRRPPRGRTWTSGWYQREQATWWRGFGLLGVEKARKGCKKDLSRVAKVTSQSGAPRGKGGRTRGHQGGRSRPPTCMLSRRLRRARCPCHPGPAPLRLLTAGQASGAATAAYTPTARPR